jgi:hypothetical protein
MKAEDQLQQMAVAAKEYKEEAEEEIKRLKSLVAKLGRENEALRVYSCNNLKCKERKSVKTCPNCGQTII